MISTPQPPRAQRAVRALGRVATVPWRLLRQQAAREDHARLMAQFTLLDNPGRPRLPQRTLVWGRPVAGPPYPDPTDPLERLWSLPAAAGGP